MQISNVDVDDLESRVAHALEKLSSALSSPAKPRNITDKLETPTAGVDLYRVAMEKRSIDARGFLGRLSTFGVLAWLPKPREDLLGPIECASWGWSVARMSTDKLGSGETLECSDCGKIIVVRFGDDSEEAKERRCVQFHDQLKSVHSELCRFSAVKVDADMCYDLPGEEEGITPIMATAALAIRFNALSNLDMLKSVHVKPLIPANISNLVYAIIASDEIQAKTIEKQRQYEEDYANLNPALPRTPRKRPHPKSRNSMAGKLNANNLRKSSVGLVKYLPSTLDPVDPDRAAALMFALLGWNVSYDNVLLNLNPVMAHKHPIVECSHCFRRMPLPLNGTIDCEKEHRDYCPWITYKGSHSHANLHEGELRMHEIWKEARRPPGWIRALTSILGSSSLIKALLEEDLSVEECEDEAPAKRVRVSFGGDVTADGVEFVSLSDAVRRVSHALQ
jgi:hypothetical protein